MESVTIPELHEARSDRELFVAGLRDAVGVHGGWVEWDGGVWVNVGRSGKHVTFMIPEDAEGYPANAMKVADLLVEALTQADVKEAAERHG